MANESTASDTSCQHEKDAYSGYVHSWCAKCETFQWREETPEEIAFNEAHANHHRGDDIPWMFQD